MDFFYREKPWYAGQFVRKVVPKIKIPNSAVLFFQTVLNKQKQALLQVLVRNVDETFRNAIIQLPQLSNGDIDFAFMENFVRELEESRLRELEAYLIATGLSNYKLSGEDRLAINNFKTLKWKEFTIGEWFERISTKKLPYKAKELPQQPKGKNTLPCITSSFMNQGLNYYAPRTDATILKNVISIPSNSDVYRAYYQPDDFTILSDAYAIRWKDESKDLSPEEYLFMIACINQVTDLPIYSYKNKLGGWNVVKRKRIMLPEDNIGQPNLVAMKQLVSAIQKIVIADVAKYTNQRLDVTRTIIGTKPAEIIDSYDFQQREEKSGFIPLYTLRAACGRFEEEELPKEEGWVDASGNGFTPDPKRHFVVHAKGESMLPKIKDGDLCVFEWYQAGSREGEIVLAQCADFDSDYDGKYTIKRYHSEKVVTEEGWHHTLVELQPLNKDPKYCKIEFGQQESDRIVGVFKCVL